MQLNCCGMLTAAAWELAEQEGCAFPSYLVYLAAGSTEVGDFTMNEE